jgi:hypothetical protein
MCFPDCVGKAKSGFGFASGDAASPCSSLFDPRLGRSRDAAIDRIDAKTRRSTKSTALLTSRTSQRATATTRLQISRKRSSSIRPMSRPTTTAASPMKHWTAAPKRSRISARRNRSTRPTKSASNSSVCSVSDSRPRSRLKRECLQVAHQRSGDTPYQRPLIGA